MFTEALRYLSAFVVLYVPDLDAAADWYAAAFGFVAVTGGVDEGRSWLHLRRSEGQDVVLIRKRIDEPGGGAVVHLSTEERIGSLADRASAEGAKLLESSSADGGRAATATFRDPYGYEWVFFRRTIPRATEHGASGVQRTL
jgi:catechol 2,3-dioxygenase-like lactoylglutathione lyase family enzyme